MSITRQLTEPVTLLGRKKATAGTVTVSNGSVTDIDITDGGAGYATGTGVITFAAPSISFTGSGIATGTNTITLSDDVFNLGDLVQYSAAGNAAGGLSAGQSYYVIDAGPAAVKLADTYTAAVAGSAVDITSVGSGTQFLIGETAIGSAVRDVAGVIIDVTITDGGNGYTSAPSVTIATPSGLASTQVIIPDGNYVNIMITGSGDGAADIKGSLDNVGYITLASGGAGTHFQTDTPPKFIKAEQTAYSTGEYVVKALF